MAFRVPARRVDQSALKVNQAFVLALLALGLVLDSLPLIAFVAVVLLVSTASPDLALFQIIYRDGLRPARLVKPQIIIDNPEPHNFAQGFGGTLVTLGLIVRMLDYNTLGWALIAFVALLALTNLLLNFCGGCFIYYQLNRLGVPGFRHSPIRVRQ
jgi:Domain of unknown function (DUF4395)